MRIELDTSGTRIITTENNNFYNLFITLHGIIMIFFFIMPGLFGGLGNIIMPVLLGVSEVAYPRINNISL